MIHVKLAQPDTISVELKRDHIEQLYSVADSRRVKHPFWKKKGAFYSLWVMQTCGNVMQKSPPYMKR